MCFGAAAEEAVAQGGDLGGGGGRVAGVDRRGPARERRRCRSRRAGPRPWRRCPAGRARRALLRSTSGTSSGVEKRIGARTGAAIRTAAAIAPAQSSSPTTVTASGRCSRGGRGEDGERGAGGVGGRVGAADPGRVVGREAGIAERFGGLRRGGGAPRSADPPARRRRRGRRLAGAAVLAAGPPDDRDDDEDEGEDDERDQQLRRAGPAFRSAFVLVARWRRRTNAGAVLRFGSAASRSARRSSGAFGADVSTFSSSAGTSALIGRFGITRGNVLERPAPGGVEFPTG